MNYNLIIYIVSLHLFEDRHDIQTESTDIFFKKVKDAHITPLTPVTVSISNCLKNGDL